MLWWINQRKLCVYCDLVTVYVYKLQQAEEELKEKEMLNCYNNTILMTRQH